MKPIKKNRHWPAAALLAAACMITAVPASAERSVVILSQQCEYVLLDAGGRQVLIKVISGQAPQTGDTLTGPLQAKDFSDLTNSRNQQSINVWVDMIDGNNRALSRYTRYCS